MKNHTSIIESTLNVVKYDEAQLKKQSENFNNLLKYASPPMSETDKHQS